MAYFKLHNWKYMVALTWERAYNEANEAMSCRQGVMSGLWLSQG